MRATLVRVAFLTVFVGIAAPAAAQRSGPCPARSLTVPVGKAAPADPIDCLFAPNGQVRAALYPATVFEAGARVHVFRGNAGYGPSSSDHPDEVLTVPRVNRLSELDASTLEQIEGTAEVQGTTPDGARLRFASYSPTTPSTQGGTADLRVISRTYDDFDRLSSETVQLQGGATATLLYTYWNNGLRKTITDAAGRVTFYEYDGRNRLSRLTANQGLPDERITTYAYWPDSLLRTVTRPDGTVTSYDYDRADRLTSIAVRKGSIDVLSYEYTYSPNGNRTKQVEVNGGAPETTTYTYDALNRLETVTYPDGRQVAYGYDDVGNRTAETERDAGGVVVSEKVAVFDAVNRLSTVTDSVNPANSATFSYDANGNLRTKTSASGVVTYTYDTRDQLVETGSGSAITARFAYDAFGRRYLKIGAEGLRQYLYDQTSLIEEFSDANVEVAKYEWDAERLSSLSRLDEPRRYFHFDALGSVAALTDSLGDVTARYHYDAWGGHRDPAELDASANRFGFTGHYFDTETKLYYAKARYFDPDFGRFLTQDSYLGEIGDPPSLHRYLYANANPLRYVDPTGHESVYQSEAGRWLNDAIMTGWGFAKAAAQRTGEIAAATGVTFARLTQNLQEPRHRIPGLEPLGKGDIDAIKSEASYVGKTLANVGETGPAALDAILELGPERSGGVVGSATVDVVATVDGAAYMVRGGFRAVRAAPSEFAEVGGNLSGMFRKGGAPEAGILLETGSSGPGLLASGLSRPSEPSLALHERINSRTIEARLERVATRAFDFEVELLNQEPGIGRARLGKLAEKRATRTLRRWAEHNDIPMGEGGLQFQVRGPSSEPDVVYDPGKMILDFKLTPRAVKERQYRAFRRDFPGYDVDYIFGRQPVVPDTRPVGTPVEAKQP